MFDFRLISINAAVIEKFKIFFFLFEKEKNKIENGILEQKNKYFRYKIIIIIRFCSAHAGARAQYFL